MEIANIIGYYEKTKQYRNVQKEREVWGVLARHMPTDNRVQRWLKQGLHCWKRWRWILLLAMAADLEGGGILLLGGKNVAEVGAMQAYKVTKLKQKKGINGNG